MTLGRLVADNAQRFPDRPAYRSGSTTLTHGHLHRRAVQLASAMAAAGVGHQDRVAVVGRNTVEFGILLAATQLSGIILAPMNVRLSETELLDALRRVAPAIVFYDDDFAALADRVSEELPTRPHAVTLGRLQQPGLVTLDEFTANSNESLPFVATPDDIAYLLFTSGTTGAAKCAVIGHHEWWRVGMTVNAELRTGSDDLALINMPMFHMGALAIVLALHARGGGVVLQQQFDAAHALKLLHAEPVTVLHLAPVLLQWLVDALGANRTLDHVRTVVYSAAPMTSAILAQATSALPRSGFLNLYGQTEVIVSGLPRELHTRNSDVLGSVGFPFPGVEVRVVNDAGTVVPTGQAGEIVVRSDSAFRGYWDDIEATQATLRNGWCHTGDIGRFDERGLLYLVDRKKDMVITGGENVFSPEVEDVISMIDDVIACAVVGVPDRRWGEMVCAVVVLRPGATLGLEAVQQHARRTLAGFKVPRKLVIAAELPVLASGKVDKKQLRKRLALE